MNMKVANGQIDLGSFRVYPDRLLVANGNGETKIAPRDMEVLQCLILAAGAVVSREEILATVWANVVVNDEAVSLSISRLRSALGESASSPKIIQTIPKRGYRIAQPGKGRKMTRGRVAFGVVSVLLVLMTMLFMRVQSVYHELADTDDSGMVAVQPPLE